MARQDPQINFRLPQELKDQLHDLAAKNKRSVNAEMVAAIELAIKLNGLAAYVKENQPLDKPTGHGQYIKSLSPQQIEDLLENVALAAAQKAMAAKFI